MIRRLIALLLAALLLPIAAHAYQRPDTIVVVDTVYVVQWLPLPPATVVIDSTPAVRKPHKQPKVKSPAERMPVNFAWGAELAGQVDMTANDMSAIGFSAYFGLRHSWLKLLGVGATANVMVNSSSRSFPVFLNFRTNFRRGVSRLFVDLRGGIAFNDLPNDTHQTGFYGSGGVGIRLASGRRFSSHLIVGYTWLDRHDVTTDATTTPWPDLHFATIRLGVSF